MHGPSSRSNAWTSKTETHQHVLREQPRYKQVKDERNRFETSPLTDKRRARLSRYVATQAEGV